MLKRSELWGIDALSMTLASFQGGCLQGQDRRGSTWRDCAMESSQCF